jgi:hypothetical protein
MPAFRQQAASSQRSGLNARLLARLVKNRASLRRKRCADAILQALLRWVCSGEPVSGVLTGSSEDGPLMTTARQRANKKMPIPTDSEGAQHIKRRPVAAAL